jgi:hypothetical protein
MQIMESLAKIDSTYREAMEITGIILKSAIFFRPEFFQGQNKTYVDNIPVKAINNILQEHSLEPLTYLEASEYLLKIASDVHVASEFRHKVDRQEIDKLLIRIQECEGEIERLVSKVRNDEEKVNLQRKVREMENLKKTNADLLMEIKDIEHQHNMAMANLEKCRNDIDIKVTELSDRDGLIKQLQGEIANLERLVAKRTEEAIFLKGDQEKTQAMAKKMLVRLNVLKKERAGLVAREELLTDENDRLFIRAAAGFENLTPRPDWNDLLNKFNLPIATIAPSSPAKDGASGREKEEKLNTIAMSAGKPSDSTNEKVTALLDKVVKANGKLQKAEEEVKDLKKKMASAVAAAAVSNPGEKPSSRQNSRSNVDKKPLTSKGAPELSRTGSSMALVRMSTNSKLPTSKDLDQLMQDKNRGLTGRLTKMNSSMRIADTSPKFQ